MLQTSFPRKKKKEQTVIQHRLRW